MGNDLSKDYEKNRGVAYQNKDITSKILAENFKGKSLRAYGLNLPEIVDTRPTNLPAIEANELRIDNLFVLADGSVAIIDYESSYNESNKLKYLGYIARVTTRLYNEDGKFPKLRIVIIYTADVKRGTTDPIINLGLGHLELTEAFLTDIDSEEVYERISSKINIGAILDETDLMHLVIYPLTHRGRKLQAEAVGRAVDLAERIEDEQISVFVMSAIIAFADKVISESDAEYFRRKIKMDKISKLIFNEGWDAGVIQGIEQGIEQDHNDSIMKLARHYMSEKPTLTEAEAIEMAKSILR